MPALGQSDFSPGGKIVYIAEPYGMMGSTIHLYDFDSQSDQLVATPPPYYGYTYVAWSPDQTKIAAVLTDYGSGGEVDDSLDFIVVMNADGSGVERRHPYYTDTPDWSYGVPLSGVSWSPDGTKIAFAAGADQYQQGGYNYRSYAIYYIDADCAGDLVFCRATGITADGQNTHDYDPAWEPLPDQPKLAFRRETPGMVEARIYTTTLSGILEVLSPAGQKMRHPAWSPDGGSLLTTQLQDNGAGQFTRSIWLVPLAGAAQQVSFPAADSHHDYPDWSPDGNGFIFRQYQGPGYSSTLYTKSLQGADPASTGIGGVNPRWYRPPRQTDEQTYYDRFKGLMFWIIYNETSGNVYEDQFDIVETAANTAEPADPNRVVLVPSPEEFSREQRSLLYMMARTLANQIPPFEEGSEEYGYQTMVQYGRNWGGSINNVAYNLWDGFDGCVDAHGYGLTLPPYRDVYGAEYARVLDWFSDYAACQVEKKPEVYREPFDAIMAAVDRAVEDHVANAPNPVKDAYFIRNANSCYLYYSGGGCFRTSDLQSWCQEDPTTRNCRSSWVWVEENQARPVGVTVNEWWSYSTLPEQYREEEFPNPYYLWNPTGTNTQQLVYTTPINTRYHISTGLYNNESGQARYFLMGVGREGISPLETIDQTFLRHWNRLNRDRNPVGPETYYPGTCVAGMAHVLRGTSVFQTWVTFTFQTKDQYGGADPWFCEAPGS